MKKARKSVLWMASSHFGISSASIYSVTSRIPSDPRSNDQPDIWCASCLPSVHPNWRLVAMFRQRCCSLLAMVLFSTVCVYAQSERPYGVFVGYTNLRAEGLRNTNDFLDRRLPMNGLNGSATLFALGTIGVTGDVSWNRNRNSVDV